MAAGDARRNRTYKTMNRPLTVLGAERRLFFVALISGGAVFSLMHSLLGGIVLFIVGVIHAAQKADPNRSMDEIKREVAAQHELPFVREKIEIPDARIHYDVNDPELGSRAAFSDVEVVTAAYRPAHMRAKTQSGFRMYANASDRSRLGLVEDEQHMLDWVMEL